MGSGLLEVVVLAALTIIVLPCCFFTLLALLDRFERSLDPDIQTPPLLVVRPAPVVAVAAVPELLADDETAGGDVVALPINVAVTQSPAAATG